MANRPASRDQSLTFTFLTETHKQTRMWSGLHKPALLMQPPAHPAEVGLVVGSQTLYRLRGKRKGGFKGPRQFEPWLAWIVGQISLPQT